MKFYVFITPEEQLQVVSCDNYFLAVLHHKRRASEGDEHANEWLKLLAGAKLIEAEDAPAAKEIYETFQLT